MLFSIDIYVVSKVLSDEYVPVPGPAEESDTALFIDMLFLPFNKLMTVSPEAARLGL